MVATLLIDAPPLDLEKAGPRIEWRRDGGVEGCGVERFVPFSDHVSASSMQYPVQIETGLHRIEICLYPLQISCGKLRALEQLFQPG